jgi:hypothetical protein
MARETKQDRVARGMFEQASEHVLDLMSIEKNPNAKETDVERWAQGLLKTVLGYTATSKYTIKAQETKGKMRPDLVLYKQDSAVCVVEVKKLGADLNKTDFRSGKMQLDTYLNEYPSVKWGLLTNGYEWRLFDFSDRKAGGVHALSINFKGEGDALSTDKSSLEDLCYDLYDLHETNFGSDDWEQLSKEATAFSPDSLARAMLCPEVLKAIGKSIRGEHEFKANVDALYDKVYDLIVVGLNDFDPGWTAIKHDELSKYVRAQKKQSKRKRRSPKKASSEETPAVAVVVQPAPVQPLPSAMDGGNNGSSSSAA